MTHVRTGKEVKARRQEGAKARLARIIVIDCTCGNRHGVDWAGCGLLDPFYLAALDLGLPRPGGSA